jgi:hypothetical protein
MPRFEIKVAHRPDINVPGFSAEQMKEIGDFAVQAIKERNATGTDIFDQPAKPLQPKYAKKKAAKGLPSVRDLRYSGNMLGSVQVIGETSETHVTVGIKGTTPYRKGIFNQNIDPWFGLSGHDDERVLEEKVRPMFAQNLKDVLK